MLEPWVILSLGGAFFQNLRSALQKHLSGSLSNTAAAYARFLYALPFALIYCSVLRFSSETPFPTVNLSFFIYCVAGSIAQMLFTGLLLHLFSFKSFAVGTTLSKLEVVVVALLGALLLQDALSLTAVTAISICAVGVVTLTAGQTGISLQTVVSRLLSRETLIGVVCAFFLGASVVCFRGASLALQHNNTLIIAIFTLTIALTIQTLLMGGWITWREPGQWRKLCKQWRWASVIGITGFLASICWFTAFSTQNASYVRSVGTIELLFTYLFSTRVFKEKISAFEVTGMVLIVAGILLLLLAG